MAEPVVPADYWQLWSAVAGWGQEPNAAMSLQWRRIAQRTSAKIFGWNISVMKRTRGGCEG